MTQCVSSSQRPAAEPKEASPDETTGKRERQQGEQHTSSTKMLQREPEREPEQGHDTGTEAASTLPFPRAKRRTAGFRARGEEVIRWRSSVGELPHLRVPEPSVACSVHVLKDKEQFSAGGGISNENGRN